MRKGAFFWNQHDTKVFCELCREEVDAGNTVDAGYLSPEGYMNLEFKFNDRTQRGYVKRHFKYKWNSLKLEYSRWLELRSAAGLGWDPETGTFGADEDWWENHIKNNRWHAIFRDGPPDNLSLLEEIFKKVDVGQTPAIPGEDKEVATRVSVDRLDEDAELTPSATKKAKLAIPGEDLPDDKEMATPVNIDGRDKDAELAPSAIAKLAIPGEDLAEDKEMATRFNIDGRDKDAELTPSAIAKLAIPGEDLAEDKEMATPVNIDGRDKDAELAPSAITKLAIPVEDLAEDKEMATRFNVDGRDKDAELTPSAKLAIPGEDLAEDIEMATPVNMDGMDKDAELTPSDMEKAKSAKRKVSSPIADALATEDRNPSSHEYGKAGDDLPVTTEASSWASNMVLTIREAVRLIRECGVSEGTALFYTATKIIAMNPEYRELFSLIHTREGRLDWIQRAHDDTAMGVHLCSSK